MRRTPRRARDPRRVRSTVAGILTAAVMATGLAIPAVADEIDDARARAEANQRATNQALEELHDHLEDTDAELLATQRELEAIQAQIPVAEQKLAEAEAELARLQREAEILAQRLQDARDMEASISAEIEADEQAAKDLRSAIGQMAREAYKGDMMASSLSAVLDAKSTEDFVDQSALTATALRTQTQALREIEQLNGANRNRKVRLAAVREEITALKAEADANVVEAEKVRAAAEQHKLELEDLHAQQEAKLAQIEAKREEQLAKKREFERQQAALESELKEIIKKQKVRDEARRKAEEERLRKEAAERAAREAAAGRGGGGGSTAPAPSALLSWPTPDPVYITSSYGWRVHPVYGYSKLHAGTDFRAYCGNPIIAAASGTVMWSYYRGGYGNQVMVDHGYTGGRALMTSYNHLSRFAVSSGQQVSRGQVLGYSGTTGTSTACHLHFEVYLDGSTVNPMDYL